MDERTSHETYEELVALLMAMESDNAKENAMVPHLSMIKVMDYTIPTTTPPAFETIQDEVLAMENFFAPTRKAQKGPDEPKVEETPKTEQQSFTPFIESSVEANRKHFFAPPTTGQKDAKEELSSLQKRLSSGDRSFLDRVKAARGNSSGPDKISEQTSIPNNANVQTAAPSTPKKAQPQSKADTSVLVGLPLVEQVAELDKIVEGIYQKVFSESQLSVLRFEIREMLKFAKNETKQGPPSYARNDPYIMSLINLRQSRLNTAAELLNINT